MLKILQARLQQYMNRELPNVQAGFRKGRGTRDQIANIRWIIEKSKRVPEKHLFLLYWLCQSLWLCRSQWTGKFWKRWDYQTTWLHIPRCLALDEWSHHRDYPGRKDLFCTVLLCILITINCEKLWKRWEYRTTWPASWEICMQVRKQQLELDMEQTGSR